MTDFVRGSRRSNLRKGRSVWTPWSFHFRERATTAERKVFDADKLGVLDVHVGEAVVGFAVQDLLDRLVVSLGAGEPLSLLWSGLHFWV